MAKYKRRKKKGAVWVVAVLLLVFIALSVTAAVILFPREYTVITLKDYYFKTFSGFDGMGSIELKLDEGRFNEKIAEAVNNYNKSFFKDREVTEDDYKKLISTLSVKTPPPNSLKNGDTALIRYSCDTALAGMLKIRIEGREEEINVFGLKEARTITLDDLFRDIELLYHGVSPNLTLEIVNNSEDEFIRDIVFDPVEYKDHYSSADVISLRAYFSDAACIKNGVSVEKKSDECIRDYTVSGVNEYLSSAAELSEEVIKEAVKAGETAFNDANTWGVRVFTEAGLVPVYVNKQATFQWVKPSANSIYFKSIKDPKALKNGDHYNDLDIIYTCDMTQADGVTTSVRAVVRFSDIIKKADGGLVYDFSDPVIVSASHISANINKVVVDYFTDDYFIEEIGYN